jgi:hypothetical protein
MAVLASLAGGLLSAGRTGAHPARVPFSVLLAAAVCLGAVAFAILFGQPGWRGQRRDARSALQAHETLVLERLVFTAAPISLGLGLPAAVGVLVPAFALSWWTQARMRSAYEMGPAMFEAGAE